jgi:hypothetical protein
VNQRNLEDISKEELYGLAAEGLRCLHQGEIMRTRHLLSVLRHVIAELDEGRGFELLSWAEKELRIAEKADSKAKAALVLHDIAYEQKKGRLQTG